VHNACNKAIALELDPYYKQLAEVTNSVHWRYWFREGITRRGAPQLMGDVAVGYSRFGRAFHHAARRANRIHFSLDGIEDPIKFAWEGRRGFIRDAAGRSYRWAAAELYIISRNKKLLKKTVFYRNGQVVPNPFQ